MLMLWHRWPLSKFADVIVGAFGPHFFDRYFMSNSETTVTKESAAAGLTPLTGTPVIELRNVSKTFGEVRSLSDVNFAVYPGEIVGLLGDNGAGKSTLVKTVMGYHRPDSGGEIHFRGQRIDDWSVARARGLGIETVYQERALCEKQPIWRNMFMGREPRTKWGLLDVKKMRSESSRLMSEHMGFTSAAVHPDNVVTTMSGGEKQGVAITRALYFDAELVILDEPTMGLSLTETKKTLDFVGNIKKAGKSAIFIDHNIFHVYPVVDRLYVLDRGKVAGVYDKSQISMDELIDQLYRVARTGSLQ
jgi:simple sugar transport system ATP-binding protein